MQVETTVEEKQGCYTLGRSGGIAVLRLGKDFLLESIDIPVSNRQALCQGFEGS